MNVEGMEGPVPSELSGSEEPAEDIENDFDEIDPDLLAEEHKSNKDWLVLGAVAVLISVTVLLLIAILV